MIGKLQLRFLDPVLARKYDSDGMATSLFTTVGCANEPTNSTAMDSSRNWPVTIIVSNNVIERLRKVLLAIMTFECTDANERNDILPNIVATATFFGERAPRNARSNENENNGPRNVECETTNTVDAKAIENTIENTIELRTSEDVGKILSEFCHGDDLQIWIATSQTGIFCRTGGSSQSASTPISDSAVDHENRDPNKRVESQCRLSLASSSSPKRSASSSLKAIAKAGNNGCYPPRLSNPTKPTKKRQSRSSRAIYGEEDGLGEAISPVGTDTDTDGREMVIESDSATPTNATPIPGFPVFSDFGCLLGASHCGGTSCGNGDIVPALDDAIATTSAVTSSSTSINTDDNNENDNDNDSDSDSDSETLLMLALAGCAQKGNYGGVDDFSCSNHEDDGLLSGLFICNDECHIDNDKSALFSSDHGHNSACSMLTYSSSYSTTSDNPCSMDTGVPNCNESNTNKDKDNTINTAMSATKTYLTPSFFETETSLSSVSSLSSRIVVGDASMMCYESTSLSSHRIDPSKNVDEIVRPRNESVFLESSSLLQGPELEMVTILESVLDSIFVPDDNDGDAIIDASQTKHPENHLHHKIPQ